MSLYELVFIAKQEVSPVRAKELAKKVNDFIATNGGKIKKEEYWGFKNLALLIALDSSFCFFVETEVILLGSIFPFSDINFFKSLIFL